MDSSAIKRRQVDYTKVGAPDTLAIFKEDLTADTTKSIDIKAPKDFKVLNDSLDLKDSIAPLDSITLNDSIDSLDSISTQKPVVIKPKRSLIRREKVDLENVVTITAADSMIMVGREKAYVFGDANVEYDQFTLKAAQIDMDLQDNTVHAVGAVDSLGEVSGRPVFSDNGQEYDTETIDYNFKTKRAYITDIITQQGEGYLTGGVSKKMEDDSYYVEGGKYTTCDDHDCPHFYLQLTRAKVVPGKSVVSGPAYMVLAGLPLPLAVPFGFFPFTDKYASGIIVPTFGDDYNRGFYLSDGGYYFAINDNIDLALTGEVYTHGSWGLNAQSTYLKRYKYSGNFQLSYLKTITGEKSDPDYSAQTNFQVIWSHTQDAKANPNMSLSASVNFTTSGYSRNDLNSYYGSAFTENTKSSTINMTYRIPRSKWSLSTSLNISQRTQDSTLSVSFPSLTVTMQQIFPFKRKKMLGDERWYEKIRLSYSGQLQNSLTAKQNQFLKKSLIKDWRNGMKHSVPIAATFSLLKYINFTPSVNLNDRMYTSKVRRQWDPNASAEVCDTSYSLYNVWDFNASVSFDTKVYGFFQPLPFLGDKVKMIRHVMTPTISFSGAPDFSSSFFGYYGTYERPMPNGTMVPYKYSMFPNSLYGVPGQGKSGTISFSLANNLEMKVKSNNDSIGEKKISLIENLSLSESYNLAADSMNWSNLNTSILLRLTKNFNLNLAATWDVYTYQLNSYGNPVRVNIPRWKAGKGIGRLSSTGTSFSYTINNDTFKKKKDNTNNENNNNNSPNNNRKNRQNSNNNQGENTEGQTQLDGDGYMPWIVPWSLSFNYSISYGYGAFDYKKLEYKGKITQNLSFSGNIRPTENWSIGFSASYDFNAHKIAYMTCNIARDLHCFTMRASIIPVGPYKSYNFHIAVKSSLLSDLKYDKRSSSSTGIRWY
ncbi:MAG: LPS-assembly protein LptD [Muribaculaceae bacterium]|nr:LPS-assembly protein LptD [Muribaculaceae bacterium]